MHDLRSRVLIGLGVILAAVVALGYASVYLGIAQPPNAPFGVVEVPEEGDVRADTLDDGLPVFVTVVDGQPIVLDARAPHVDGAADSLLAWCADARVFLDLRRGGSFAPDGQLLGGSAASGLRRFATASIEGGGRVSVGPGSTLAGDAPGETVALDCVRGSAWVVHAPDPDDVFDPSVAADEEPEDWFWVEGRLATVGAEVRLCDGLAGPCTSWAVVNGIDPASAEPAAGLFLARVQDDALRDLVIVPDSTELGGSS
jgi:hypothetical protein